MLSHFEPPSWDAVLPFGEFPQTSRVSAPNCDKTNRNSPHLAQSRPSATDAALFIGAPFAAAPNSYSAVANSATLQPQTARARSYSPSDPRPTNQTMSYSTGPSTPRMRPDEADIVAPWSAPLLKDVLMVESQGEDLDVAALGVSLASLALLDKYTVPGWLPALLDEQRCPLSGSMPPTPSWCFEDDYGAVPIGVVRSTPERCHPNQHHRPPNLHPRPPPHATLNLQTADAPIRPAPCRASPLDGRRAGHGLRGR